MSKPSARWMILLVVNVAIWGVLSLYRATDAAQPQAAQLPFANAVEQRGAMLEELRQIRRLMEEQNRLLRQMGVDGRDQPVGRR